MRSHPRAEIQTAIDRLTDLRPDCMSHRSTGASSTWRGRKREIVESEMSNLKQQPHGTKHYMFLQLPSSYLYPGLS